MSWSYSKLLTFESCKLQYKLKHIDRIPEEKHAAADRGTAIHGMAEEFIIGKTKSLQTELLKFDADFLALRDRHSNGLVAVEQEWGFGNDWQPTAYKTAWLRMKADAVAFNKERTEAIVIDFKGLPLSTLLPTPTGWTTMGEVQVGDELFSSAGIICTVIGKSKTKRIRNYKITFDDTSTVQCDAEHRWKLLDGTVKEVTELKINDAIAVAEPIQLPETSLPIDPYVLGIWLADGKHTSGEISKPDQAIWDEIRSRGYEIGDNYSRNHKDKCRAHTVLGLRRKLLDLGMLRDKIIPMAYMRASHAQRLALLQGIFDGDGSANSLRKQAVMNTVSHDFALQVKELLLSLGQRPLLSPYIATGFGKQIQAYYVSFRPRNINPFLLPRKASKIQDSWGPGRSDRRKIRKIERVERTTTQCIAVDSADNTFLCTENFVPTHNTGRKFGNEIKHGNQVQLYALASAILNPTVQKFTLELWYLDKDELTSNVYTREQAMSFVKQFDKRAKKIDAAHKSGVFEANPNQISCQWCPYGPQKGNQCPHGYTGSMTIANYRRKYA